MNRARGSGLMRTREAKEQSHDLRPPLSREAGGDPDGSELVLIADESVEYFSGEESDHAGNENGRAGTRADAPGQDDESLAEPPSCSDFAWRAALLSRTHGRVRTVVRWADAIVVGGVTVVVAGVALAAHDLKHRGG